VLGYIFTHKLAQDLCRRLILRPADLQEPLAQIALNPYAKTGIFHRQLVYPMDTHFDRKSQGADYDCVVALPVTELRGFSISSPFLMYCSTPAKEPRLKDAQTAQRQSQAGHVGGKIVLRLKD
jgi:hypothetical protein